MTLRHGGDVATVEAVAARHAGRPVRGVDRSIPDPRAEPTITAARLARVSGMSVRGVYSAIERGDIPAVRVGRRLIIPTRDALVRLGLLSPEEAAPVDPVAIVPAEVIDRVRRYRAAGLSAAAVARALDADEVEGPGGEPWTRELVERITAPAPAADLTATQMPSPGPAETPRISRVSHTPSTR